MSRLFRIATLAGSLLRAMRAAGIVETGGGVTPPIVLGDASSRLPVIPTPDRPMRRFSITIDIAAPVERVWQVMSDVDRWHEWTPSITSVARLGDRPFAVGSRVLIRQPKFPPALWTVTDLQPGRSFTWVSIAPGLRVTGHHVVEPIEAGSRATLSLDLRGALGGLWGRLTKPITQRYLGFEANGLKARSENPTLRRGA